LRRLGRRDEADLHFRAGAALVAQGDLDPPRVRIREPEVVVPFGSHLERFRVRLVEEVPLGDLGRDVHGLGDLAGSGRPAGQGRWPRPWEPPWWSGTGPRPALSPAKPGERREERLRPAYKDDASARAKSPRLQMRKHELASLAKCVADAGGGFVFLVSDRLF